MQCFYAQPVLYAITFAGKLLISQIQKLHFWPLQVVHNTYGTTYDELLSINSDVSIHQRYLRFLVTDVFKSVNNLDQHFMWDYSQMNFSPYDLRKGNTLHLPRVQFAMEEIHSHSKVVFFGITFLEKLRKVS